MPRLSRHLPPAPEKGKPLCGWIIIIGLLAAFVAGGVKFVFWAIAYPFLGCLVFMLIVLLVLLIILAMKQETQRMLNIIEEREGESICTFRRAFDLHLVDPWIVRATYQEFQKRLSEYSSNFPIRVTDRLDDDLKIIPEDVEDIFEIVAARAGYDFTDIQANPMLGKVATVEDFVMFFTHQPCLR